MSGHTGEKRWKKTNNSRGFSQEVTELSAMMLDVLYKAEKLGLELEELESYVDGGAKEIADQLFYEDWVNRETDPQANPGIFDTSANDKEIAMVEDAINAVEAAKEVFDFANDKTNDKSRISKMRRMA